MIAAYWIRDSDTYSIAEHTPPSQATKDTQSVTSSEAK
jgi:hypothetical protein